MSSAPAPSRTFLPIPPLLRRVFDSFPLKTYPAPSLPASSPRPSQKPTLHIFTTPSAATNGAPSFDPACLRLQTYLRLCGLEFTTAPASAHAAPAGELPYLTPAGSRAAVPARKIISWAQEQGGGVHEDLQEPQIAAFLALVEGAVRDAYLYALYLEPTNFLRLAAPLYTRISSSVGLVQIALSHELRAAAETELRKSRPGGVIVADEIYADAAAAWKALDTLLGDDEWFFGAQQPGMLDATVFAFAHLVRKWAWDETERRVQTPLETCKRLMAHEERLRKRCGW